MCDFHYKTPPIDIEILKTELLNHPDRSFVDNLIQGLTYGFQTGIHNPPDLPLECRNLLTARQSPSIVSSVVQSELDKGYMIGPFNHPPFQNYRISPIGLVEKKYSAKKRLIVDLSAPHDSETNPSINTLIDKEEFSLSYVRIDDAIQIIKKLGPGSWLCKTDIVDAFKLIPIHPSLWHLYGVKWEDSYYFYTRLTFGWRSSPKIFDQLSQAICWIAHHNYGIKFILHLLDDFLTIDSPGSEASRTMALLTLIFAKLKVPISPQKTFGPCTVLEYLGILLDTNRMEARLPPDKLQRLRELIQNYLGKKTCTKRKLLSLLGHLNFACRVVIPGRTFISRLLFASKSVVKLHHYVTLNAECRADLLMWNHLLNHWNGVSLFLEDQLTSAHDIELFTDASGSIGYGGYYKGQWFAAPWPQDMTCTSPNISIAFQEMYPIVVAGILWGKEWSRKRILFRSDNKATVHIINKGRSNCPLIMKLMRKLVITAAHYNFAFSSEHVPGSINLIADALSRLQIQKFHQLAPGAHPYPCPIPSEVMFN